MLTGVNTLYIQHKMDVPDKKWNMKSSVKVQ